MNEALQHPDWDQWSANLARFQYPEDDVQVGGGTVGWQ